MPTIHKRRPRYTTGELAFTDKEVDLLFQAADSYQKDMVLRVALATAMRREDLAGIRIRDINLNGGYLAYQEKKKKRIRRIPIPPSLVVALRKYLTIPPAPGEVDDRLFPVTGRTLFNYLQEMCDRAGIPRRPFHALRATAIKRAQRRGWTPEQVAALTGDTIEVIQAHYSTPSEAEMAEVMREKELI